MSMNSKKRRNDRLTKLTLGALTAALSYVVFTFLRIDIPIGVSKTSIHLANAIVVLGAELIGGVWGGLGGAIGLSISDLFTGYVTSAPKTFLMKLLIGLIAGAVAHRIFKISKTEDPHKYFLGALVASIAALLFNAIFDPIVGYFYKLLILGKPAAELTIAYNFLSTGINSVTSVIVSTALYLALRPALKKAHLLPRIGEEKEVTPPPSPENES